MTWHRKIPGQAACGPCCGIKEKLQTLWDRTINSILRINQVEPDDQGNIRITSDSEALTVSEGTNEIILGLDTSELPAAAVQSVNGQTGVVALTADDIPTDNGDVQTDIDSLEAADTTLQGNINAEALTRANADTALQNNINAVQASIPTEAAAAVAADPTVLSFAAAAADIPNKVDKRTGSGLRAYTHDGSTQDDTPVIDGTTGTTIPIRDSNGRLQAADPAAGATDKTLTTANWVSQTGDSGPNNLVHKSGNETISGIKTFKSITTGLIEANTLSHKNAGSSTTNAWRVMAKSTVTGTASVRATFLILTNQATRMAFGQMLLRTNGAPSVGIWLEKSFNPNGIAVNYDTNTGECLFLVKTFYNYQAPRFIPLFTQRNDGVNIDALDYSDNTQYASEAEFPHANTIYASYLGTDTP